MAVFYYITTFSGVAASTSKNLIAVNSMNFGGDDPNGFLTPSDVVLECDAGDYSPKLLQAFVEQAPHKVVIKGHRPNVQGFDEVFVTVTLLGARVLAYESAGNAGGDFSDRLHLNFVSLDFDYLPAGVDYVWAAPA